MKETTTKDTNKINVGSQNGEQSSHNGDHLITDTDFCCFYLSFLSQSINCTAYSLYVYMYI